MKKISAVLLALLLFVLPLCACDQTNTPDHNHQDTEFFDAQATPHGFDWSNYTGVWKYVETHSEKSLQSPAIDTADAMNLSLVVITDSLDAYIIHYFGTEISNPLDWQQIALEREDNLLKATQTPVGMNSDMVFYYEAPGGTYLYNWADPHLIDGAHETVSAYDIFEKTNYSIAEVLGYLNNSTQTAQPGAAAQQTAAPQVYAKIGEQQSVGDSTFTPYQGGQYVFLILDETKPYVVYYNPDGSVYDKETSSIYRLVDDQFNIIKDHSDGAGRVVQGVMSGDRVYWGWFSDVHTNDQTLSVFEATDFTAADLEQGSFLSSAPAGQTAAADPQAPAPDEAVESFVGTWEGTLGDVYKAMSFYEDGTMIFIESYEGDTDEYVMDYQFNADGSYVLSYQSEVVYEGAYECTGEYPDQQLVININGQQVSLLNTSLDPEDYYYMPAAQAADDSLPPFDESGLMVDVGEYIEDTYWISTGVEYPNPQAQAVCAGCPVTFDFNYGELGYTFFDGLVERFEYDEYANDAEYIWGPYGFYVYGFDRTEMIDGQQHSVISRFFIKDGYLYEVEVVDGVDASNVIQFELYE